MPLPSLSVDEIITTINGSSLPTILVEGVYDASIYRWIEQQLLVTNADIVECGGRKNLIKVYEKRSEIKREKKIIFLADQDMWIYSEIPEEYKGITFTKGYSIENDLLEGSINKILKLFNSEEVIQLEQIFEAIIPWHSYEVNNYLQNRAYKLDHSIHRLLDIKTLELKGEFRDLVPQFKDDEEIFRFIKDNPFLHIRGKNVLDIISLILQSPKRDVTYSKESIIDIILRFHVDSNINLIRIIERIKGKFNSEELITQPNDYMASV
ncbi:DUF4435 domain-containing protein [Bacillus niameyensis]|uniref:DUF4435 domain-containing protein n=1 Tax=Bacillus niameyensis TaxID=1522308 RepID=UPI000784683E|nr:DUF4435 domain-containing protein [Bacillus niameyensis]